MVHPCQTFGMILRLLPLILTLLVPLSSVAEITLIDFNRNTYSRAEGTFFNTINLQSNIIYGGLSGTCDGASTSVCDSCATLDTTANPIGSCNRRRVHDALQLQVTVRSDTGGQIAVTNGVSADLNQTPLDFTTNAPPILDEAGGEFTVFIPWSEICIKVFGMANCDAPLSDTASAQRELRIGVASSGSQLSSGEYLPNLFIALGKLDSGETDLCTSAGTGTFAGACNFVAYPGDKKIFLEQVRTDCGFPNLSGSAADVRSIRVYYKELADGDLDHPSQLPGTFTDVKDILVSNSGGTCTNSTKLITLDENEVDGLTNDTSYRFAIGVVDEAENVGFVTQHNNLALDDKSDCFAGSEDEWPLNCHAATPSDVLGLIEKEFDCFITTAAYGTPFRPKVEVFRQFRNQYLETNWVGSKVIDFYYEHSPQVAYWMRNHPNSKPVVRAMLWPLWAFAKACLTHPYWVLACLCLGLAIILRKTFLKGAWK